MSTDENIQRLRAVRRGHRGVITKATNEISEILGRNTPLTNELSSRLRALRRQLEAKLTTLNELDERVLALVKIEDIDKEIEESEVFVYKINEYQEKIDQATKQDINIGATASLPASSATQGVKPKLPKLTLPHFKGDVTKWTTFWDSFKSSVHQNSSLAKVDKFNHLKSLLEGPAARAVQGLALSDANYDAAIELLEERFGRTQQIIAAHMDELLRIPSCTRDKSSSLRYVYDTINVHVRGLASLGVSADQYGSLLIPIVMSKLPEELRLRVAREAKGEVWELDNILQTLKIETEAREASDRSRVNERPTSKTPDAPPGSIPLHQQVKR